MKQALPAMNQLKTQGRLPFRFYALHRGGESEKARKIIESKDVNGQEWKIDFVWSSKKFEDQLGGVKGLPSYYIVDRKGRVRAVIKGHTKDTVQTLSWLIAAMEKNLP